MVRKSFKEEGMTFIEVIVVILISSILMLGTLLLFGTVLKTYKKTENKINVLEEMALTLAFIQQEVEDAKTVEVCIKPRRRQDEKYGLLGEIVLDGGTGKSRKLIAVHNAETQDFKFFYSAKGTNVNISEGRGKLFVKLKGELMYLTCRMQVNENDKIQQYLILPITYKGEG